MAKKSKLYVQYKITRVGSFTFPQSLASKNQCVRKGHSKYFYTCELFSDNDKLDKIGFIVDHQDLDKAIRNRIVRGKFKGSCERMSEKIIEILVNMLDKKGVDFNAIRVTLKGQEENNPAFIMATYVKQIGSIDALDLVG